MSRLIRPRIHLGFFLLANAIGVTGCSHADSKKPETPVPTVKVSYPLQREITDYAEYTGRTAAIEQVQIRARVSGYLDKINFKEGAELKQGTVLFEIDPRPYEAALEQVTAQVEQQQAQLTFQNSLYERDVKLYKKNAEALQQLQQDKATRDATAAALASARAQLKTATLNKEWTQVKAPIDGRIGRTLITKGNLVVADQTPLTTLVSQDPMYAYFEADEPTVLHVQQLIRKGELPTIDEGAKVPVDLGLSTEQGFPHKGYLNFVNNQFNLGTATLQLRGKFPNPKPAVGLRLLAPGQFVRIRIPISGAHQALLITQAAVGTDQNEKYVFVVDDKGKVERKAVELGAPRPGLQVISKGLAKGDRVIIDGLQHVRAGEAVNVKVVPMPEEQGKGSEPRP